MEKLAYIFPGQGAQFVGMGKELCDAFPVAKEIFDRANEALGFDLAKLCFEGPKEELSTTSVSQPAILTTSIAFLRVIEAEIPELKPSASLGLSLGEYSALVAAGSVGFEDAVKLVRSRGQFMEEASQKNPGTMASLIGLNDINVVNDICVSSNAEIANLNCPGQIVISGKHESIEKASTLAMEKGAKRAIKLDVSGPFHSSLMNDASAKLEKALEGVKIKTPSVPVISNVNAQKESSEEEIKKNLVEQVSHKTYWEKSINRVAGMGINTFLEIGPGKVLKGLLRRIDPQLSVRNVGTLKDIEELKNRMP